MKKTCENCGKEFENNINIDGKRRNLQRRRFCLDCSPFGAHNTSKNPQVTEFKKEERAKAVRSKKAIRYRQKLKRKLIIYKGSKCEKCGYDKDCPGAFSFHHRDPKEKDFGISNNLGKSKKEIYEEVDKCDLLCVRCHAELHHQLYLNKLK